MRRVLTAFVLAGASALVLPCAMLGQRGGGHAGGFSGGHVGGFSSGGFAGHSFGVPSGGFTARSFPAPRMNFMPGPASSGYSRFAQAARPYGGFTGTRSPFGQLSIPAVRRAPYPGAVSRGLTNQPYTADIPTGTAETVMDILTTARPITASPFTRRRMGGHITAAGRIGRTSATGIPATTTPRTPVLPRKRQTRDRTSTMPLNSSRISGLQPTSLRWPQRP